MMNNEERGGKRRRSASSDRAGQVDSRGLGNFSYFDSILLRPSQFGYAITETHHDSLSVPVFLILNDEMRKFLVRERN